MPTCPQGQKRPADSIGCAIMVGMIATGEVEDTTKPCSGRTKSGKAGAKARAESLTKERRSEIAKKAAKERWKDA
ncbi:MAG: RNA-binding protein [Alphaproteobacteria bacterium]|nr:RNA-binding protein [Alphaproteobacteria bacterium]